MRMESLNSCAASPYMTPFKYKKLRNALPTSHTLAIGRFYKP